MGRVEYRLQLHSPRVQQMLDMVVGVVVAVVGRGGQVEETSTSARPRPYTRKIQSPPKSRRAMTRQPFGPRSLRTPTAGTRHEVMAGRAGCLPPRRCTPVLINLRILQQKSRRAKPAQGPPNLGIAPTNRRSGQHSGRKPTWANDDDVSEARLLPVTVID